MATEFKVGQVWEVEWTRGSEPLSTEARVPVKRRSMLVAIEEHHGQPHVLWFGCPMIPGRQANRVYVSEWPEDAQLAFVALVPGQ
jgi:hypothetical protein